jgi:hypothetical protein
MRLLFAFVTVAFCSLPATAAPHHDRQFWKSIVDHGFGVPAGNRPADLVDELTRYFGSPDPVLRDEYAYSIIAQWVYGKRLFAPDELRHFIAVWTPNLRTGLSDHRIESVLRRSFCALALSTIAALDNAQPFLDQREYDDFLDRALQYLHDERDLRGYDQRAGWIHATAHTADLLKFLSRSRHLQPGQQGRIFAAISQRLDSADVAFTHGEETRLARVCISLFARDDFHPAEGAEWLQQMELPKYAADERVLVRRGNIERFLFSLYTLTATDPRLADTPAAREVRTAIASAIARLNG